MKVASRSRVLLCFSAFLLIDICYSEVKQLKSDEFDRFLIANKLVLILFKASNDCPSCNKALEYFEKLPQPDLVQTEIQKRYMTDHTIAERLGAMDYPSIVFFRNGYPALYSGKLSSIDDLQLLTEWLTPASQVATQDLHEDSFEHLTQASTGATTGDWFVLFFKPGSEDCMRILPSVESAAISLKHRMNFAKVDVEANKKLAERFKITACPYGILLKQGKMYPYEPRKFNPQSLVAFTETWFKNVKSSPVPKEPTAFDILTESIALYIKQQVEGPNKSWMFISGIISVCILLVIMVICLFRRPTDMRQKQD